MGYNTRSAARSLRIMSDNEEEGIVVDENFGPDGGEFELEENPKGMTPVLEELDQSDLVNGLVRGLSKGLTMKSANVKAPKGLMSLEETNENVPRVIRWLEEVNSFMGQMNHDPKSTLGRMFWTPSCRIRRLRNYRMERESR